MHELHIQGTYNIRDLGGLIVADGVSTKQHVLLRSGNLDKLPTASQQQLIDYGVKTVIDLRDEWEARDYPNVFAQSELVDYYNIPLIGDALSNDETWNAKTKNYIDLATLYITYLEHCKAQIGHIISAISESENTTIIHCYAGKDRTGIITALLLASVGVSDDMIATDYALSYEQIQHLVREWRTYAIENKRDLAQLERDAGSLPETILEILGYIRDKHHSIEGYLKPCGISKTQLEQIKLKFIEP